MSQQPTRPPLDADGFLLDPAQWSEDIAHAFAAEAGITLDERHVEVLYALRAWFLQHGHSPAMRAFVSLVRRQLGDSKGRSVYLLQLFPGSPAKVAARIAGLPRPEHCL
jgi:tRNA 2-thiouridine synthesizing protein E